MITVLALVLPPQVLIPVHGVVQMGSNAGRAVMMAKYVVLPVFGPFIVGSIIGAIIGGMIAVELPSGILSIGLALFILFSVWGRVPAIRGRYAVTAGVIVSTFLTMFFGATGPFVSGMIKTLKLDRMAHVGTVAFCMTAQHTTKVVVFGLLGFAYGPYLGFIAMMIAMGLLGTWLGKRLLLSVNDRIFHTALNIVLSLLAIELLRRGLKPLLP